MNLQTIPKKAKVCPVCKMKQKNPIITIIGILLLVFGLIEIISGAEITPSEESNENPPYITMDEFNAIQTGMSYEEVIEIIGSDGTASSEVSLGDITTKIYIWYGKDGASNANVTFVNGEVTAKAQFALN